VPTLPQNPSPRRFFGRPNVPPTPGLLVTSLVALWRGRPVKALGPRRRTRTALAVVLAVLLVLPGLPARLSSRHLEG
jgi:hypothetical protein